MAVLQTALRSALTDFHRDLERAGHLLRLVKAFRRFAAASAPPEGSEESVGWKEAQDLALIAPEVRTDLPILAGSLLLYVSGRFEYFVRSLVLTLADGLSSSSERYVDLPEALRKELFGQTLEVAKSPHRYGYSKSDAEQLVISLAGALAHQDGQLTIRSEVLAITDANMHSRTLADLFKRVDVTEIWRDVAKQAPLKALLEMASDNECRAEVTSRLDTLMKERNSLAHPTSDTMFPDVDQVMDVCVFFKVLGQVLVDVLCVPR